MEKSDKRTDRLTEAEWSLPVPTTWKFRSLPVRAARLPTVSTLLSVGLIDAEVNEQVADP